MMKKKIVLIIIIIVGGLNSIAQSLSNSAWTVYDTTSMFYTYFRFDNDTLYYSDNDINYNTVSTFSENGNNFYIVDLPGYICSDDTGKYTFSIQNDSLKFALISDTCPFRPLVFARFYWVRNIVTGIQHIKILPSINIFPNPADDYVYIKSDVVEQGMEYNIYDLPGRKVLNGIIATETTRVDISDLPEGSYIIRVGEKATFSFKLIKK